MRAHTTGARAIAPRIADEREYAPVITFGCHFVVDNGENHYLITVLLINLHQPIICFQNLLDQMAKL